MTLRERLVALSGIIADEAEHNSRFRRRIEEALNPQQMGLPVMRKDSAREHKPHDGRAVADGSRRRGRRTQAVLDPLDLARQSEDALRRELSALDIEQLKDVVAQYGMDPGKLVMKWKDSARIVDRIVELAIARSTKGDAFRADKPPASDLSGD